MNIKNLRNHHLDVSENRGIPKWMVYNGKPYQNGWFGGKKPYFWFNTHLDYMTIIVSPAMKRWSPLSRCRRRIWRPATSPGENPTQPATLRWWCHQTGTKNGGILTKLSCKAYVRENSCPKWPYKVLYLHFRYLNMLVMVCPRTTSNDVSNMGENDKSCWT